MDKIGKMKAAHDPDMTLPILYTFRRCPYAMRARMALMASLTDCEVREIKLSAKPDAMLHASPKGTVPVLVLPDGEVIEESLEIMAYALSRNDPDDWLGGNALQHPLVGANDGPFKHHLDRYKYPSRYEGNPNTHRAAGLDRLRALNAALCESGFLTGPAANVVDVALFPFVRQFAAVEPDWFAAQNLAALNKWLADWTSSALFKAIMTPFPLWTPGSAPVTLLQKME